MDTSNESIQIVNSAGDVMGTIRGVGGPVAVPLVVKRVPSTSIQAQFDPRPIVQWSVGVDTICDPPALVARATGKDGRQYGLRLPMEVTGE